MGRWALVDFKQTEEDLGASSSSSRVTTRRRSRSTRDPRYLRVTALDGARAVVQARPGGNLATALGNVVTNPSLVSRTVSHPSALERCAFGSALPPAASSGALRVGQQIRAHIILVSEPSSMTTPSRARRRPLNTMQPEFGRIEEAAAACLRGCKLRLPNRVDGGCVRCGVWLSVQRAKSNRTAQ